MDKYIGALLDNRYRVLEIIGVGGMAVVYKGHDIVLDRYVAIKILKDEFMYDEDFKKRFANESHAVAQLSHNNIVSVYDVSRSDNPQYIVMELIEGITLKEYLTKKGALSWQETLFFTQQIAKALEHAHSRGIIHQDIKPHNICLVRDGTVKVTDFGIARFEKNQETRIIQEAIGSVHYISPEQAKGSAIDHRADLYSLGVMMYEMLTGSVPFNGDSPLAIVMQHINSVPPKPSEIVPGIPLGMDDIVMHAMCPTLNKRYGSATEIYNDLEKLKHNPSIRFNEASSADRRALEDGDTRVLKRVPVDPVKPTQTSERKQAAERKQPIERKQTAAVGAQDVDEEIDRRSFFSRILESPAAMGVLGVLLCLIIGGIIAFKFLNLGAAKYPVPSFINQNITDVMLNPEYSSHFKLVESENRVVDNSKTPGTILEQTPPANTEVREGTVVKLTVSKQGDETDPSTEPGDTVEPIKLDDFTGKSVSYANLILNNRGLKVQVIEEANLDVAKDNIIRTEPEAGTEVTPDTEITLYVSSGPEGVKIKVPYLIGQTMEKAQELLRESKLSIGQIRSEFSDEKAGLVFEQSIDGGTEVDGGTEISFKVSLGSSTTDPDMTTPPADPEPTTPSDPPAGNTGVGSAAIDFTVPASDEPVTVEITIDDLGVAFYKDNYNPSDVSYNDSRTCFAPRGEHIVYIDVNGIRETRTVLFE